MSCTSRRDYLRKVYARYQEASSAEKERILDEFCANCDYNRKYAIRLLKGLAPSGRAVGKRRRRRGLTYGPRVQSILKAIWEDRKQFEQAEGAYRAVIDSASRLKGVQDAGLLLEARGGLANLLEETHQYRESEAEFQRALAFASVTRAECQRTNIRITYFASLMHFYQDYVEFLVTQHKESDELKVVESSRARVLAERLGEPKPVGTGLPHYEYRRLARDCGTTLLSYWLAPERSFLLVVTPERVVTFQLPGQSEIETLVTAYNEAIQGLRDLVREDNETGRKLYDILLGPARPYVRPGSNVTIVPDGARHNLNFESLPVPGSAPHYWIEDIAASIVPLLDLAYGHRVRRSTKGYTDSRPELAESLLLFGDPEPPKEASYPKLPNATSEISEIQKQFQQAVMITGAAADPHAYGASRPERFSMIHFAAYAEANREDPWTRPSSSRHRATLTSSMPATSLICPFGPTW